MLCIFVFIVVLIFAVIIYYAEFFVTDTFHTIPDGYWWAIITLTTVSTPTPPSHGEYPRNPQAVVITPETPKLW